MTLTLISTPDDELLLRLESPADAEHMAIGMANVHLVHVVHPDRHPDSLVALFVSVPLKGGGVCAAAPASLRPLTKKDASLLTRSDCAKRRRSSPVPQFLPSPLFKPCERAGDVGHVQYRSQSFSFHGGSRITRWAVAAAKSALYRRQRLFAAPCCIVGHPETNPLPPCAKPGPGAISDTLRWTVFVGRGGV